MSALRGRWAACLFALGAIASASDALGYDSKCLVGEADCEPGPATARNRWDNDHAEHMQLWDKTLASLRLPKYLVDPITLRIPTQDLRIGGEITVSPRPLDIASKWIERQYRIGEMAQLPDLAYSVWDWVLGNEICPLGPEPEIKDCHSFTTHMGTLNSSHFLPQAQNFFNYYHGLAMSRAKACSEMRKTLDEGNALITYEGFVQQCDQLAFTFEAVAHHYLQDAWSVGHMWPRWGGAQPSDFGGTDWRERAELIALTVGLIHGSRGVLQSQIGSWKLELLGGTLKGPDVRDAMCAPLDPTIYKCVVGDQCHVDFWDKLTPPSFRDGVLTGDTHLGIGDLYANSLTQDAKYAHSWSRMTECAQGSVIELAAAAGITLPGASGDRVMQPADAKYSATCFGQRVTKGTLWLGGGIDIIWQETETPLTQLDTIGPLIQFLLDVDKKNHYTRIDFRPLLLAQLFPTDPTLVAFVVNTLAESQGKLNVAKLMESEFRVAISGLADDLEVMARNDPGGAVQDNAFPRFMTMGSNAQYIHDPPADYLDPQPPYTTDFKKLTDARSIEDRGTAIARAYHRGFALDWCLAMTTEQLESLRDRAKGKAPDSGQCKICTEFAFRHVRIGESQSSYDHAQEPLCNYLAGVEFIYQPLEDPLQKTADAARIWCGCAEAPSTQACTGQFGARIVDAETQEPIPNAVAAFVSAKSSGETFSDEDGAFLSDELPCDAYAIEISAENYLPASVDFEVDEDGTVTQVIQLAAIDSACEDTETEFIGWVADAATGDFLPGATVELRAGAAASASDPVLFSAVTDNDGVYSFPAVPGGYYTRSVSANGYEASSFSQVSICEGGGYATDVHLIPTAERALSFVLNWARPADLDLHLLLPTGQEVSFGSCAGALDAEPFAHLDIDHQMADGPEAITVSQFSPGEYLLFVHNYSAQNEGGEPFAESEAEVLVYRNSQVVDRLLVPTSGDGFFWSVVAFSDNNGEIVFRTVGSLNDDFENPADQTDGDCTPDGT